MKNIVYIQKIENKEDIFIKEHPYMPNVLKELIYWYKKTWKIFTKKHIENKEIWLYPIEKYEKTNVFQMIKKLAKFPENKYIFPEKIMTEQHIKWMKEKNLDYGNGRSVLNWLVLYILQYIYCLRPDFQNKTVTILVEEIDDLHKYFIKQLVQKVKSVKIVTPHIYQLKELEQELYEQLGIGIQISNSYRKSLAKENLIINLDRKAVDVNLYQIFPKAVMINGDSNLLSIQSKLFQGIVINSCHIHFQGENGLYDNLVYYESLLEQEKDFRKKTKKIEKDQVVVTDLIGTRGRIQKQEFKML